VTPDQVAQLFHGVDPPAQLLLEAGENLLGLIGEELDEDVVLVLEIEIDSAVGDPGLPGDLRYRRLVEAPLGEDLDGGL